MSFVLLVLSAMISVALWVLGVGVPEQEHQAMGWVFVSLHIGALLFVLAPPEKLKKSRVLVCLMIVPIEVASLLLVAVLQEAYQMYRPNSDVFIQSCRIAGSRFYSKPTAPVESIGYDWNANSHPPLYNHFSFDSKGRVTSLSGGSGKERFPKSIKFIESRCCRNTGPPTNRIGPYIRHTGNEYFGVTELTADVLVTFESSKITQAQRESVLTQVDVEVSDRRSNTILATHRYFLDLGAERGCGETSPGTMDETSFVKKAIGID